MITLRLNEPVSTPINRPTGNPIQPVDDSFPEPFQVFFIFTVAEEQDKENNECQDTADQGGDPGTCQPHFRYAAFSVDKEIVPDDIQHIGSKHDPHRGNRVGRPVAELLEGVEQHGEYNGK